MRFTVTPDWKDNQLLRLVLVWFLVFVALLWVTNALLYFAKMTLNPASVVAYYLGNEAHLHAAAQLPGHARDHALPSLRDGHPGAHDDAPPALRADREPPEGRGREHRVRGRARRRERRDGWCASSSPGFAYLKVAAFLTLEAVLAFMVGAVLWAISTDATQRLPLERAGRRR